MSISATNLRKTFGSYTALDGVNLNVQAGRLVLFHSWLRHSVETNKGSGERISVAFNVMFRDFAQRYARPTWKPKIKPASAA